MNLRDRADASRNSSFLRTAPETVVKSINAQRRAAGMAELPFDGLPDDDPRHSQGTRIFLARRAAAELLGKTPPRSPAPKPTRTPKRCGHCGR